MGAAISSVDSMPPSPYYFDHLLHLSAVASQEDMLDHSEWLKWRHFHWVAYWVDWEFYCATVCNVSWTLWSDRWTTIHWSASSHCHQADAACVRVCRGTHRLWYQRSQHTHPTTSCELSVGDLTISLVSSSVLKLCCPVPWPDVVKQCCPTTTIAQHVLYTGEWKIVSLFDFSDNSHRPTTCKCSS